MASLTITSLDGVPFVQQGDNLADLIWAALQETGIALQDGDILVLAQKIVSKAEGRTRLLHEIQPSELALELGEETEKDPRLVELILSESSSVLRTRPGLIIVEHKLGFVCANAGIDHSNVAGGEEAYLLLPENPDASAERIKGFLEARSGCHLGVMIIDSHGRAWRMGTVGVAIGFAGMPGLVDLRGRPDLFGYELQVTQLGAADELAGAASLMMGQAGEGTPVVHVRGFPYPLRPGGLQELIRPHSMDLFR